MHLRILIFQSSPSLSPCSEIPCLESFQLSALESLSLASPPFGWRKQRKPVVLEMGLKTESLLDHMRVHDHKADAIHQAQPSAAQIQPKLIGPLVHPLIHPQDIQNPKNVLVPEVCRLKPDPPLKQAGGLPDHVV